MGGEFFLYWNTILISFAVYDWEQIHSKFSFPPVLSAKFC